MDYKRELYNYLSKCNGNERSCDLFFELYTLICSFDPPVQHLAVQYMFTTTLLASLDGKGRRFSLPYTESQLEYAMELVENNFYPEFKRKVLNAINQKMEPEKFYHMVWREIRITPLLTSRLERAIAFCYFAQLDELPYPPIPDLEHFDSAEFKKEDASNTDGLSLTLEECCQMIKNCLATCNGNERQFDVYFDIYTMITSLPEEKQPIAFDYLCKTGAEPSNEGPGRENNPMFTDEEIQQAKNHGIINFFPDLQKLCHNKFNDVFDMEDIANIYRFIWTRIVTDKNLTSDLQRACAMHTYIFEGLSPTIDSKPQHFYGAPTLEDLKQLAEEKRKTGPTSEPQITLDDPEFKPYFDALAKRLIEQKKQNNK